MNDTDTKFFHVKRLVRKLVKRSGLQIHKTTNTWVTIFLLLGKLDTRMKKIFYIA